MARIEREKKVVAMMIAMYCRRKEGNRKLCPECVALTAYAHSRLDGCRFGERKTSCLRCPVHCYRPDMKSRIREVMRFAGPRMIFCHPVEAVRHMLGR